MSGGDNRNRPSFHIPGKEFLIVIVVVFSSLSFTLGYFVGKSKRDAGSGAPAVPVAQTAQQEKSSPSADVQAPTGPPGETDYTSAAVMEESGRTGEKSRHYPEKQASPPLSGRASDRGRALQTPGARGRSSSKGNLQKGKISYTVQIGAFSNENDAEDLGARYRKKGYKAYIVPARNKRGETIYKTRIGEFRNRKNAELLSLKLRKTEGLNTFVTFKDE